jgi:hypothetical protein
MADQVHDAGLDNGLREGRVDRLWEALETVHDRDQDVTHAAVLQLIHQAQLELSLRSARSRCEYLLRAVRHDAKSDINSFVTPPTPVVQIPARLCRLVSAMGEANEVVEHAQKKDPSQAILKDGKDLQSFEYPMGSLTHPH